MAQAGVFVCGSSGAVPGSVVEAFLKASSLGLSDVEFAPVSAETGAARYAVGLLSTSSKSAALAAVSRRLLPGGVLYLHVQDAARDTQAMQRDLILHGFVDDQPMTGIPLHSGLMVCARRPNYEIGAKTPLSLKHSSAAALSQPTAPTTSTWQLNTQEEDEMLDDDELLTEEDKARPDVHTAGDCSTSKKACKNCSCGRAEKEATGERVQLTQEMLDNPQSSCGSCTLGDAFRCAGCPYRGLPPFEQGKKIQLASDFLTADA